MNHEASGSAMRALIIPFAALAGASLALLLAGRGGHATKTVSANTTKTASQQSVAAWRPGTTPPKVTSALIAQAVFGLTAASRDARNRRRGIRLPYPPTFTSIRQPSNSTTIRTARPVDGQATKDPRPRA